MRLRWWLFSLLIVAPHARALGVVRSVVLLADHAVGRLEAAPTRRTAPRALGLGANPGPVWTTPEELQDTLLVLLGDGRPAHRGLRRDGRARHPTDVDPERLGRASDLRLVVAGGPRERHHGHGVPRRRSESEVVRTLDDGRRSPVQPLRQRSDREDAPVKLETGVFLLGPPAVHENVSRKRSRATIGWPLPDPRPSSSLLRRRCDRSRSRSTA